MGYVYRVERIARLLALNEPMLRLERQFGPPKDYPHRMIETVRKQLPTARAVYKLDFLRRMPAADALCPGESVLIRVPARNSHFAELTCVPDERAPESGVTYFGVDAAVSPTNRMSKNLFVPFEKVDVRIGDKWLTLTPRLLEAMIHAARRPAPRVTSDAA